MIAGSGAVGKPHLPVSGGLVTAHGVCLLLYLQRGQFANNIHRFQD